MQTTNTQKHIVIRIPIEECKDFRGKKTGRVKCRMSDDGYEVFAESREELASGVDRFFRRATQSTGIAYVRVGDAVRIIVDDAHGQGTYRRNDEYSDEKQPDGLIALRSIHATTDTDILEIARDEVFCQCQQHWAVTGKTLDCLPEEKQRDFASWVVWQERYRSAIENGKADHEAHAAACQMA